ncbi:MAG TPA: DoxX family protein [Stellaceae bacterium]
MLSRTFDNLATRNQGPLLLLGRLAIGVLYVPSGFGKLTGINGPGLTGFAGYLASHGVPGPAIAWSVVAAVIEFFASVAIVVGFQTRLAALLMILFTIIAAFIGHPYWTMTDPAQIALNKVHFFKDITIIGGLLYVFVRGAGPISVDRR